METFTGNIVSRTEEGCFIVKALYNWAFGALGVFFILFREVKLQKPFNPVIWLSFSSILEANCWHKWLFLTDTLLTFLPRICPSRKVHFIDTLMGFAVIHQVVGEPVPISTHLWNAETWSVYRRYWYYCHTKVLLCSHYIIYASGTIDLQASGAESTPTPLNIKELQHLQLPAILSLPFHWIWGQVL